jgi:hypothetical protein
MVVYIVHEFTDEQHSITGVFASVDKAIATAREVAEYAGLDLLIDCDTAVDYSMLGSPNTNPVVIEFADFSEDNLVWVEETEVIE